MVGSNENLSVIAERAANVEMAREIHTDEQFTGGETLEKVEAKMRNKKENEESEAKEE